MQNCQFLKFLEWETVFYIETLKNLIEPLNQYCSGIIWQTLPLDSHWKNIVVLHVFLVPIILSYDKLWGLAWRVFTLFFKVVHLIFPNLVSKTPFQGFSVSPVHWCIKCSACCCQVRFLIIINLKIIILQQSAIHTCNDQNKVRGAVSSLWGQQRSQTDQGESLCNGIFCPNITTLAMRECGALRSCWLMWKKLV